MPEFFLELFSEEIPARMQHSAREQLYNVINSISREVDVGDTPVPHCGPRRIAVSVRVAEEKPGEIFFAKGPKENAPEPAILGFMRKYGATRANLHIENGYYFFRRIEKSVPTRKFIEDVLPDRLRSGIQWPKSMRWGQSGEFSWIRPLRRVVCILDGEAIPIKFGPLTASNLTEGNRMHSTGPFPVSSAQDWHRKLWQHNVICDDVERESIISRGFKKLADSLELNVVEDKFLLAEVIGLAEWPVPLLGKIDEQFMNLPPEVRELSMKVNQKYFSLRDLEGKPAPYFAFVANLEAPDGGTAIIAGNERVLRARLADARYFWERDLMTPLNELLPKLERITFHTMIGTQRERAERIATLAREIAETLGADAYQAAQAEWAGRLCKADLVTGMVSEFPELQGVMGGYYAEQNPRNWDGAMVGLAIRTHYQPRGPSDDAPAGIVTASVALADKLDTLVSFFRIEERPTGSSDPYALRRAALGIVRIIRENAFHLPLKRFIKNDRWLFDFIIDRLQVLLRNEGKRHDVVNAVLKAGEDDDLLRLLTKTSALSAMLGTDDGANLLAGYRRTANILKDEESKSFYVSNHPSAALFVQVEEATLYDRVMIAKREVEEYYSKMEYGAAMICLSLLRAPLDLFFDRVTVNTPEPDLRLNRLRLLALLRDTMHQIADFSKIES